MGLCVNQYSSHTPDDLRQKVLEQDKLAAQQEYEKKKTRYGIPASEEYPVKFY